MGLVGSASGVSPFRGLPKYSKISELIVKNQSKTVLSVTGSGIITSFTHTANTALLAYIIIDGVEQELDLPPNSGYSILPLNFEFHNSLAIRVKNNNLAAETTTTQITTSYILK